MNARFPIGREISDEQLILVLVPVFNEEDSVGACYRELSDVMERWNRPYELVFVNDGSVDTSGRLLDENRLVGTRSRGDRMAPRDEWRYRGWSRDE